MDPVDDRQATMSIVVSTLNDAIKSLMNKLGNLLHQEQIYILGIRGDFVDIDNQIILMLPLLRLYMSAATGERELDLMRKMRELAYDIEDYMDDLSVDPRRSRKLTSLRGAWYLLTAINARQSIAKEIRNFKIQVQQISERMRDDQEELLDKSSRLDTSSSQAAANAFTICLAPPANLTRTRAPVSMDDAIKELEPWFAKGKQSTDQLKYVAIVGFAGLGKTMLAKALYRKFGDEFDCRASVTLSRSFSLQTVLKDLLMQISEQQACASNNYLDGILESEEELLIKKLGDQLMGMRYLILVDDLQSLSEWERIKICFPQNKGGTIVVTTRVYDVATAIASQQQGACIYTQKPLSEENSCKLFHRIISGAGDDIYPTRPPISGRVVMKMCGGIPLVINLLAGLVASRLRSEPGSNIDLHLSQIGEGLSEDCGYTFERLMHVVDHCYNTLPTDLKLCLLYLSIFPKGCWMSRNRLIRRWITERLITERHQKTVEEVAEENFNELIGRNLIWEVNKSVSSGKVKSFKVHDIVLEYIVAKSSAEDFISVVGGSWLTPVPSNKVRRLSIQNGNQLDMVAIERCKLSHVRSLTSFKSSIVHSRSLNFKILKLLDLEDCKDLSLLSLKKICNMHQLKYLSLRRTNIETIPEMIDRLKYLEVLDIRETKVRKLPASLERLQKMTHLLTGNKSNWISLTLTEGVIEHLRVLAITCSFDQCNDRTYRKSLLACINKQLNLQSLTIHCGAGCSMEFMSFESFPAIGIEKFKVKAGKFVSIPKWLQGLNHLSFLQITICKLLPDDVIILQDLPKLQCLVLHLDYIPRKAIVIESEGFRELMRFSVECPVPWFTFRTGAMPKLIYLQLKICSGPASQRSVPSGICNLKGLTEVVLDYNKKWCANSSSVKMTVEVVKKEIDKRSRPIDLVINDSIVNVQEVEEMGFLNDDIQANTEKTLGEIEAEDDNINEV